MLGLTSIDLLFLGNLRSNWVVVIGLELLSLACPGLVLGSCYVTSYYLCHPCCCYGYVDPISVENRCDGKPLGCSVKLRCWNRGMVWVKLRWLEPTRHKRGLLGRCDAHAGSETSVGT
jgi:hypothetical protein